MTEVCIYAANSKSSKPMPHCQNFIGRATSNRDYQCPYVVKLRARMTGKGISKASEFLPSLMNSDKIPMVCFKQILGIRRIDKVQVITRTEDFILLILTTVLQPI